jgi:prepilin-type N-terminal cleavage/methylation domain-containing protein
MASRNRAFTIVELLAVVTIIGILAGLIFTGVEKSIENAKVTRTRATIHGLGVALTEFEHDFGAFDVEVGDGTAKIEMPVGPMHKSDSRTHEEMRIRLIRILSGREMNSDGSFQVDQHIRQDKMWNGPYLDPKAKELTPTNKGEFKIKYKAGQLVDAWGNPLMIQIKESDFGKQMKYRPDSFEIHSFGPNYKDEAGKGDDINNWE